MEDSKEIKLMKFWLFGTFVIIFAATTVYIGQFVGLEIMKSWQYWASMGAAAALSVVAFQVYKSYLTNKE